MPFEYSKHWLEKKEYKSSVTEDMMEYCILKSKIWRDKYWSDALNAIARVPPSRRTLKVVYKPKGKTIKILTAYWLD